MVILIILKKINKCFRNWPESQPNKGKRLLSAAPDAVFLVFAWHIMTVPATESFPEIEFNPKIEIQACEIDHSGQSQDIIGAYCKNPVPD